MYTYKYVHTHTHIHAHTYTHTQQNTYTQKKNHTNVCMCAYICVLMCGQYTRKHRWVQSVSSSHAHTARKLCIDRQAPGNNLFQLNFCRKHSDTQKISTHGPVWHLVVASTVTPLVLARSHNIVSQTDDEECREEAAEPSTSQKLAHWHSLFHNSTGCFLF